MASLWARMGLRDHPSHRCLLLSFSLPSSRATLTAWKLAIHGCKVNVSLDLELPLNLLDLSIYLKSSHFLFSSATLALCFSPSGNHLACLWMNWLRVANSLLHCREKLSEKLPAKHPDSQPMQNSQHQWSDHFLISVRLHVSVRLFIWISAGSICNLFRALYHKFVDKVVQTNTLHSFLLLLVLFYIYWQYILRFILWA